MIEAKQIPAEQQIFTEVWLMLKEHYHARTESDWSRLLCAAADIDRRHRDDDPGKRELGRRLILAVADYIENMNRTPAVSE